MAEMCNRPGCVAESTGEGLCFVHRNALGVECEKCKGSGMRYYSGQGLTMACLWCSGTGLKDKKTSRAIGPRRDDPVDQRGLIERAGKD